MRTGFVVAGIAAVVAVDQAVKALVRGEVPMGSARELIPGVELVHTENTGVSFGFLNDAPPWLVGLVSTVAMIVVFTVVLRMVPGRIGQVAMVLIVGGALGNLIDRILFGAVTDFLDLPLLPPCNVADIAITFGAIAMFFGILMAGAAETGETGETSDAT